MADFKTNTLLENLCFGEGPRWHDGHLWFSDIYDYQIKKVDQQGQATVVTDVPQQPSGLGWLPDGDLLYVSMLDRRLMRVSGNETKLHADLSAYTDYPLNDMIVDSFGNAYVGGYGFDLVAVMNGEAAPAPMKLLCVSANGDVKEVGEPVLFPNGMAVSSDGKTLIVAETFGSCLTAFNVQENGDLTEPRTWAALPDVYPDGIALDTDGAVWVATARGNQIIRVAEGGEVLETVALQSNSFACAIGGDDGHTLFIMTAPSEAEEESQSLRAARIETLRVATPAA